MSARCRAGAAVGALSLVVLSSCVDTGVVEPDVDRLPAPSLAILDGSTTGNSAFYFLPPLAEDNPPNTGEFNPNLLPSMRVCELDALLGSCVPGPPVASLPPGSATVSNGQYQISWDTDGPETGSIDTSRYYRLEILVGTVVMGWIELDPQDPDGPGQSVADAYPFRLGETIPVKFSLGIEALCETAAYVTECISGAVVDESGANLSLDEEGHKLGVIVFEGGLPGENHPPITLTLERIDPDLFLAATGVECIPLFDAPQFEDCFRITPEPLLEAPLDLPSLVSICLDPTILDGINVPEDQQDQLTMVRYDNGVYEGLADAPGDCPTTGASLLRVPDSGILRYAALGVNALARFVGPTPLAARDIRLGGFTSSFSRFRYTLPGQMLPVAGDGTVLQSGDPAEVEAVLQVVDHAGIPVENAIVHFATDDGSVAPGQATTDADGFLTTTWTVDNGTPGDKVMTASALGLLEGAVPEHSSSLFFTTESVSFHAAVVGPPTSISASPTDNFDDAVAGEPIGDISVTLTDAGGHPVAGVGVAWSGDGVVSGGEATGGDGTATASWTAPTSAGPASMTATAGTLSATFTATVGPAAATHLVIAPYPSSATAGSDVSLSVTVTDMFDNPRADDPVAWSITSGGGVITGDASTGPDGSAGATWTLGPLPGANGAGVVAGGLSGTFTVAGECFAGYGTAYVDGTFDPVEWACARMLPFDANISGGSTPAEVYWMNDAANVFLAVRVRQGSLAKANNLRFDFDNDGDGSPAVDDDVIGYDADDRVFFDESLSRKCVNSSQAGCSVGGEPVDGAGAVDNDGEWTVYELVHPLDSGDAKDLAVAPGDAPGFFLTLRIGNGAQGNTQFPGFREYAELMIVGF